MCDKAMMDNYARWKQRATLHNAEQMALLDIRPGDMVYGQSRIRTCLTS